MQRQAMAESIVTRDEAALGRKFDPKFRSLIVKGLTSKSLVEMSQIPTGSVASSVPDALGDTANDLVYTPVTPCRIYSKRSRWSVFVELRRRACKLLQLARTARVSRPQAAGRSHRLKLDSRMAPSISC